VASTKNPFEVFGLTPEMTGRRKEKDLFTLVKTMYRSLHKVHHPDRNTSKSAKTTAKKAAQAVELNLAFEMLNLDKEPESFRHYKKLYSAQRRGGLRKKIDTLKNDVREVKEKQADLAEGFMLYLLRGLPWLTNNGAEPTRLVPAPTNLRLGLNDVAINQNVRFSSWRLGSNYKEIIFDALGGMLYRPVGRAKPFPVNFIHLLGAIAVDKIDLLPLLNRVPPREGFFKCPALDSRYGIDEAPLQVLNTISMKKFKQRCLPLLSPDFTERSYLFSINRPVFNQEGNISVEGVIVKISSL